jgi:hypothetical protein
MRSISYLERWKRMVCEMSRRPGFLIVFILGIFGCVYAAGFMLPFIDPVAATGPLNSWWFRGGVPMLFCLFLAPYLWRFWSEMERSGRTG